MTFLFLELTPEYQSSREEATIEVSTSLFAVWLEDYLVLAFQPSWYIAVRWYQQHLVISSENNY